MVGLTVLFICRTLWCCTSASRTDSQSLSIISNFLLLLYIYNPVSLPRLALPSACTTSNNIPILRNGINVFSVHTAGQGTVLGHGQAPGTLYGIIIEIIESTLNIKYVSFRKGNFCSLYQSPETTFCLWAKPFRTLFLWKQGGEKLVSDGTLQKFLHYLYETLVVNQSQY